MASVKELASDYGLPLEHVEVLDIFRPPNWRLEEAELLRREQEDNPLGIVRHRDPLVTRLARFLYRWHNALGDDERQQNFNRKRYLRSRYADLLWAYPVVDQESRESIRLELEARILSRQNSAAIGKRLQVPERMIDVYHACFYEVRHRLDNAAYIMNHCLQSESADLEGRTKEFVVRLFGYFGGVHMMEPFLYDYPTDIPVPASPVEMKEYFKEVFKRTLSRRGVFMASFFSPTRFNVSELVSTVRMLHQSEDDQQSSGGLNTSTSSASVVQSMVSAIEWTHGTAGRRKEVQRLGKLATTSRRPSLEEQVRLGLGESISTAEDIQDWKFPPPKKKNTSTVEGSVTTRPDEG